jgi:hypothetical protein
LLQFYLLAKVIGEWSLQEKVISLTSDQGNNIKKCLQDLEKKMDSYWLPCTSHLIQGCINKAWDQTSTFAKITSKCQWISNFFNGNSNARDVIKRLWTAHNRSISGVGTSVPLNDAATINDAIPAGDTAPASDALPTDDILPTNSISSADDTSPAHGVPPVPGIPLIDEGHSADNILPVQGTPPVQGTLPVQGAPLTSNVPSVLLPPEHGRWYFLSHI